MTSIENTYICLAVPLLLAIMCLRHDGRRSLLFVVAGMTACLLSAYVSTFIAGITGTDLLTASYEISPVVEEIMKSLPLLFYLIVFEPERQYAISGTLMIAAAATGGDIIINGCIPTHMDALSAKLLEMGVKVTDYDDAIRVHVVGPRRAINVKTQVYPGFPTDLQQPMSALLTTAKGTSLVTETIFEQRFRHLDEIRRMGAHVRVMDRTAIIEGVPELYSAPMTASDLRAGAALIIAALMARGTSEIYEPAYIDRGYEHIEDKLRSLGAEIRREPVL